MSRKSSIENVEWQKEWTDMPHFYPPTRNTPLRNKIDVSDIVKECKKKTTKLPKYPIYIISKGRWDSNYTSKSLEKLKVPYHIVVEPDEYSKYASVMDKTKILVLPFNNLGQGGIPARNWVLEHSISTGAKRHWILDDNINGFGLQKGGRRINTSSNGNFFSICENFVDRYQNIAMAGIRYRFHHNYVKSPYYLNTRIYSCILVKNDIPFKWRGKYNEDTDLSLRVLKAGLCTMLFTWCYCNKASTLTVKGGNTDTVYATDDNRLAFAESLVKQHPDVAKVVFRYGRNHHDVDYSKFRNNKLIK